MKGTFKKFINRAIFNTALLILVLSACAFDGAGTIQYVTAFVSCMVVLVYAYANGWTV